MDNELSKIIGKRIGLLLSERKIKQKDLAEHLGITDNTISYFCSGKRMPNTTQIKEIAQFFNVSADYLLGISSAATADKDIQFIGDYLNLSAGAIENLHSIWFQNTRPINFMLESAYPFTEICEGLLRYEQANKELNTLIERSSQLTEGDIEAELMRLSDNSDLARYKLQQAFDILVDRYCTDPRTKKQYEELLIRLINSTDKGSDPHGNDQETE